jgi:hypothetical protein
MLKAVRISSGNPGLSVQFDSAMEVRKRMREAATNSLASRLECCGLLAFVLLSFDDG